MGFFNDFIRGATPAIEGGTNIGLRGMAEAQRKRELQDEIQRQTQQQAFVNMMKQQEMEYGQQRDAIGDQRYAQEYQDAKFLQQTNDAQKLGFDMLGAQNQLADNNRQDKIANAQIGNYQEGRAPSQEEFMWQQMTPEQKQAFLDNYTQNKFKPASGGQGAQITPSGLVSLRGQMTNPMQGGRMDMPFDSVAAMAGKIQNTADSLNAANGGQPQMMPQGQSQIHPALQKMIQGGVTKEQILQDYMENEAEYQQMGITVEMLQGL